MTQIFYPTFPNQPFVTNFYSTLDKVYQQTDANNHTSYLYIAGSRAETDDPYLTSSIQYLNSRGNTTIDIDGLGRQTTNQYDGLYRLTKTTLPEGNFLTYAYDQSYGGAGAPVRLQNVTSITANPKPGSPLAPTVRTLAYDANCADKVASATDANNFTTLSLYDPAACTLTRMTQPLVNGVNPITQFTYNARGQVFTKTDPLGKVTTYGYDPANETLLSVIDDGANLRITSRYGYDATGNVTSVTDPDLNVTTSVYDNQRRVTQVTGPAGTGAVTQTTYNSDGLVTQTQRATGNTTAPWAISTATYSYSGKTLTSTDANGNITHYAYDLLDRVASVTDPSSRVTTYAYDVLSRQTGVSNPALPARPLLQYAYTDNGRRKTLTDANGNVTTYVYDGLDRPIQTQYPSTALAAGVSDPANYDAVQAYDANGNPLQLRKRDGSVITITYDALNRPLTKQYPNGVNPVYYSYDLAGRLLSARYGSLTGYGNINTYDTAGRLATETHGDILTYGYDNAGNRTRQTWSDGFYVNYAYDALNRMTQVRENGATSGPGLLAVYAYDPLSRRTTLTRGNGSVTTYGHDIGGRLTSLALALPAAGAAGNLTLGFGYSAADQLTTRTVSNGVYGWPGPGVAGPVANAPNGLNQDGPVAALAGGYDANGNLGNDGVRALTYDYDDRLAQVVQGTGAAQTTAALVYYPGGELQQVAVTTAGATTATQFLYDGDQMVGEYNSGVLLRRYVRGADVDEPLVWYDSADGFQRRWLHADERGSIIGWSDGSGVMRATFSYGPYGEPSSWAGTRFAYTGQMALPEVTLYHDKARVYDPVFGHFLQTDPIGYEGGANLYAYVEDDPTDLDDPTGMSSRFGGGGGNGWAHAGLAAASFCPSICGSAFSAIDGGLYAREGDRANAAISFGAAAIGLVGDAGAAKLVGKAGLVGYRALRGAEVVLPEALTVGRNAEKGIDVYMGIKNSKSLYCGITCNITRRASEHGNRFDSLDRITTNSVTRGEARAIEQALITRSKGTNILNSISPNHSWYGEAVNWGESWLKIHGH